MFKDVGKGLNLELHIASWGWAKVLRTNVSGRIEESIKSMFLGKKGKTVIGFQIFLTRCLKALKTTFWSIYKNGQLKSNPKNKKISF